MAGQDPVAAIGVVQRDIPHRRSAAGGTDRGRAELSGRARGPLVPQFVIASEAIAQQAKGQPIQGRISRSGLLRFARNDEVV